MKNKKILVLIFGFVLLIVLISLTFIFVFKKPSSKLSGNNIGSVANELLSNSDGNTYSYMGGNYLREKQSENYVWYNGFLWRIMGVNKDGTIRMITQEGVSSVQWGADNSVVEWDSEGFIRDWLNNYFLNNLDKDKSDIIKDSTWCVSTTDNPYSKRKDCTDGVTYTDKVGLITIDEYNLSGDFQVVNTSNYLVNGQHFWTMTPFKDRRICNVSYNSKVGFGNIIGPSSIRPVINVDPEAIITSGNGTINDVYILNQNIDSKTGKLSSIVSSGEYVVLNNKLFRVVSKDSNGVKLISEENYQNAISYGVNDEVNLEDSKLWKSLNSEVLDWIGDSNKIISTDWYSGKGYDYGTEYTIVLNDTTNKLVGKVGLIRVNEMLATQSMTRLTKNYSTSADTANVKTLWTMNFGSNNKGAWYISSIGTSIYYTSKIHAAIRPVIVVSNNTEVVSGNGTFANPYKIG